MGGVSELGPQRWNAAVASGQTGPRSGPETGSVSPFALLGPDRVPAIFVPRLVGFESGSAPSSQSIAGQGQRALADHSTVPDPVADRLFDLKVATADVAMHLEQTWRSGLFRQLDDLLSDDSWHADDALPTAASYRTFLRLVILLGRPRRPSLGCSEAGNLIASWRRGEDRLTIECRADDDLRWVLSRHADGDHESAAGICKLAKLQSRLAPYQPEAWFVADETPPRS
jgi:hypothetical protein